MRRQHLRGTWTTTSSPGLFANANLSTFPVPVNSATRHPVVNDTGTCELSKRTVTFCCAPLAASGSESRRSEDRIKAKT